MHAIYVEDDHVYLQGEQGKTYFDNCDVQVVPRIPASFTEPQW